MPARHNVSPQTPVQTDAHFICPEESEFFALCIEHFIFQTPQPETIVEFGSGDGGPVLHALQRAFFSGTVYGYEINPLSAALAQTKIAAAGQTARYQVTNTSFFTAAPVRGQESVLIANPPYIPAPEAQHLRMPELWGGPDGADVLRRLFDTHCNTLLLLLPSIANPVAVLEYGLQQGYHIQNYLLTTLPFGQYTSQSYVQRHLQTLRRDHCAFYFPDHYSLAGVLWKREPGALDSDRKRGLLSGLTAGQACGGKDIFSN